MEPPPLSSAQVELLERVIGTPEERTATVSFVEQSAAGAAAVVPAPFAGMTPGTPAGTGASWGTVPDAAEGLSRRQPGLQIEIVQRDGAVVVETFEMIRPEGRRDAMGDLAAEADKHGWTLVRDVPAAVPAARRAELSAAGFTPAEGAADRPATRWTGRHAIGLTRRISDRRPATVAG